MTQTSKNFYTNLITLVFNILVGLYYTPYLVDNLGLEAYGILPLTLIVNQFINVVTGTLTHSFTRFYTLSVQSGELEKANKVLSTSFWAVCVLTAATVPFLCMLCLKIDSLFTIPPRLLDVSRKLFIFTVSSFYISLLSSLLNVTLYAVNKLDLMNLLKIVRNILKLVLVVMLFELSGADLLYVGVANFTTELVVLVLSVLFFRKIRPEGIHLSLRKFDKVMLVSIVTMSIWILVQQCGDTLIYRTDNLVINHFWGTKMSGILGAVSELCSYVIVISNVFGSLFGPLILIAYSESDHDSVRKLALQQSRIVGCISAVLAGVLAGLSSTVLRLWLGESFVPYNSWMAVKLTVIPFYAAGAIMSLVYRAWNHVKLPALGTLVIGMVNVSLTVAVCLVMTGKPVAMFYVILVSAFSSILQSYVWNTHCVHRIYSTILKESVHNTLKIILAFVIPFLIAFCADKAFDCATILSLFLMLATVGTLSLATVCFTIFNKDDRNRFMALLR